MSSGQTLTEAPQGGAPTQATLNAIKDLIAYFNEMMFEPVQGRDIDSRFPGFDGMTSVQIGEHEVWSDGTHFWFDSNNNGTIETMFDILPDGRVVYDLNNDGFTDTIVNVEGYP